jgi:hypothetical protein
MDQTTKENIIKAKKESMCGSRSFQEADTSGKMNKVIFWEFWDGKTERRSYREQESHYQLTTVSLLRYCPLSANMTQDSAKNILSFTV